VNSWADLREGGAGVWLTLAYLGDGGRRLDLTATGQDHVVLTRTQLARHRQTQTRART